MIVVPSRVIGLDPSLSSTGVVIRELRGRDGFEKHTIGSKRSHQMLQRQRTIVSGVVELLREGDLVIVEDFGSATRNGVSGAFCERMEMIGMLKDRIPEKTGRMWIDVHPGWIKSYATGKASNHKSDVRVKADEFLAPYELKTRNSDEADALWLCLIGESLFFPRFPQDKKEAQILAKVVGYKENGERLTGKV